MRSPVIWFVVLVNLLVGSMTTAASGDPLSRPDSREARDHLDRGNKLYNVGSFEEAITEYKAGALVEPAAVFDYNLGQSNRQLGKYRDALWHYDRFLHKGHPTRELRDAVIAFMAEMRAHLENKAKTMPPRGPEPGSEVSSSANTRDPTPAGDHRGGHAPRETSPRPIDQDDAMDWPGWSLAATGVIALGASGVLFYRASQLNNQGDSEAEMRARQSLYDQASSRNLAGAIVGIGGAALTAAGIIRLTLHHSSPSQSNAINIGFTSRGVFAAGTF